MMETAVLETVALVVWAISGAVTLAVLVYVIHVLLYVNRVLRRVC